MSIRHQQMSRGHRIRILSTVIFKNKKTHRLLDESIFQYVAGFIRKQVSVPPDSPPHLPI
jgi:hypothetical protein